MTQSLFAKVQAAAANLKVEEQDVLGGFTFAGGLYPGGIKMAYIDAWKSGALFVGIELALLVDGKERTHKEMITISNKDGEFEYADKKSGEKQTMPGFQMIDTLFRLATGKGFVEQTPVVKKVKMRGENNTEVMEDREVFMETVGKRVHLGMILSEVDKTKKNDMTGVYEPTGETRQENTLHKVFEYETKKTIAEVKANLPAKFFEGWEKNFADKVINKVKGTKAVAASGAQAGIPTPQGNTSENTGSLFGGQ